MPLMRRNVTIRRSRAATCARIAGGLSLPVLVLGVLGVRFGIVPQLALQPVLVAGFTLGVVGLTFAVYALVDIWMSGAEGAGSAVVGIFYATPVLIILGVVAAAAIVYPRVSDVATDVDDPPRFVIASPGHSSPDAASLARRAEGYPNIVPRLYPLPLGDVFVAAHKVVDSSGWTMTREVRPALMPMATSRENPVPEQPVEDDELVQALAAKSVMTQSRAGMATETLPQVETPSEDSAAAFPDFVPEPVPEPPTAIIEATAPTPLFGFLDDVVIRMRVTEDGSTKVDVRSASRTGAHDLGQNARRIKGFFAKLDAILQPEPGAAGVASR